MAPATSGAPKIRIQARTPNKRPAEPGNHGRYGYATLSPSGATAYITTPSARPVQAPTVSAAGVIRLRRAVSARVMARPQAVMSRTITSDPTVGLSPLVPGTHGHQGSFLQWNLS